MEIKLASVSESTGGGDISAGASLTKIEVRGWSESEQSTPLLEYHTFLSSLPHILPWLKHFAGASRVFWAEFQIFNPDFNCGVPP